MEITDAVILGTLSHIYDTSTRQQLTMPLYAQIFSYLVITLTWSMAPSGIRLLESFSQTALRRFEDDLASMKQISKYALAEYMKEPTGPIQEAIRSTMAGGNITSRLERQTSPYVWAAPWLASVHFDDGKGN